MDEDPRNCDRLHISDFGDGCTVSLYLGDVLEDCPPTTDRELPDSADRIIVAIQQKYPRIDTSGAEIRVSYQYRGNWHEVSLANDLKVLFAHHKPWAYPPNRVIPTQTKMASFKWSRVRTQTRERWEIENRIRNGIPYESSLDGSFDPLPYGMKHKRYGRGPGIVRDYRPLDDIYNRQDRLCHAVDTSVCFIDLRMPGLKSEIVVVLYDVEMSYLLSNYTDYLFSSIRGTFFNDGKHNAALVRALQCPANHGENAVYDQNLPVVIMLKKIVSDQSEVLSIMSTSMDSIELDLANDDMLSTYQPLWRKRILHWKIHLHHMKKHLDNIKPALEVFPYSLEAELDIVASQSNEISAVLVRLDSLYQTMMATMSIVESDKAIREAKEVGKLTSLAFFFIPLSFASSVFGMNIVELGDVQIWIWVTTSVALLLATYVLLYRKELCRTASRLPQYLHVVWNVVKLVYSFLLIQSALRLQHLYIVWCEVKEHMLSMRRARRSDAAVGLSDIGTA